MRPRGALFVCRSPAPWPSGPARGMISGLMTSGFMTGRPLKVLASHLEAVVFVSVFCVRGWPLFEVTKQCAQPSFRLGRGDVFSCAMVCCLICLRRTPRNHIG